MVHSSSTFELTYICLRVSLSVSVCVWTIVWLNIFITHNNQHYGLLVWEELFIFVAQLKSYFVKDAEWRIVRRCDCANGCGSCGYLIQIAEHLQHDSGYRADFVRIFLA